MKRTISLVLVAMMLVACMATMAFAAEPGDTVTITFASAGNPGFATFGAKINYNADVLELVSISQGALCGSGFFSGNVNNGVVGFAGTADVTGDGVLFTATFNVKADAPAGTYAVTASLDSSSTANAAAELVSFGITGGEVVIEAEPTETEPAPTETEPTPTETEPGLDPVPPTGDITPYIVMTSVMFMAAIAAAFTMKRKAAK